MNPLAQHHPLYDWYDQFVIQPRSRTEPQEEYHQLTYDTHGMQGYREIIHLREGMILCISDVVFGETMRFESTGSVPWIELSFCLKGGITNHILGHYDTAPERDGDCFLLLAKNTDSITHFIGGERSHKVELMMNPLLWGGYTRHFWNFSTDEELLSQLVKKSFNVSLYGMSPAIRRILQQIVSCSFEGISRRIYMESKALELLAVCSKEWAAEGTALKEPPKIRLNRHDIDKINQARDILIQHMEKPPSLLDIARQIGMNDWKLKIGFRELHGTTVFGYLRDYRLEKARSLIEQGDMNVNEAAVAVGYSNPSHFAGLFREKYGMNPSHYIKER